jgi:DNA (cytosine-5)-methyltransferase 1
MNVTGDVAKTLQAEAGGAGVNEGCVVQSTVYSIDQGAGKSGCNFDVNKAPTLTTTHGGEPVVLNDQGGDNAPLVFGRQHDVTDDNITPSLCAKMGTGGNNVPCVLNTDPQSTEDSSVVFENHSQDTRYNELGEVCQTVSATWGMGGNNQPLEVKPQQAIVRRLTPLECERLQGFPDYWTHIGDWVDSKGKKHKDSDSPKYKALGNSIALPFWYWMAGRMVAQLKKSGVEHPTMFSLFSGIGGFEYVFKLHRCEPVASSEIEEFPIAVVKKHFGDEETGEVGDIDQYLKLPPNWRSAATPRERVTDSTVAFDRAAFNQGANAKYDFSVEQGVAQTLLSRGPGGVCQ